jgi:glycosyltransferase involved in cell wall biosynthesis
MGVAQGMDILLDLAAQLLVRRDVGFLFVGRGSEYERLKTIARVKALTNTLFFDEIHPDEIPGLYAQCHVGIVTLDPRHRSHNIPGKFLTYMQSGLPVIANINPGNDLVAMIRESQLGQVCESGNVAELTSRAELILEQISTDNDLQARCLRFFEREFSVGKAVRQVVAALSN